MSKFLKVKCKCGNEKIVFGNTVTRIDCDQCNEVLAEPSGGKSHILGKIVGEHE